MPLVAISARALVSALLQCASQCAEAGPQPHLLKCAAQLGALYTVVAGEGTVRLPLAGPRSCPHAAADASRLGCLARARACPRPLAR